jgi:uncharacterized protein (UPF0261 family)
MSTVLLLGTLDTKGEECRYVRERLRDCGCDVLTMDVGVLGTPAFAVDVPRERVAAAAGASLEQLAADGDRGAAIEVMGRGAAAVVRSLFEQDAFSAILALGGSGGASLGASAMAALPLGFPKLLVSTVAAGDTRPYVEGADIAMLHPVVDLAGINPISARVLDNAAAAVAGMAQAPRRATRREAGGPLVGMTMFGITTPCVDGVRALLADRGYVPLVFSANGVGGTSMEQLIADGSIAGVVDVTTTELADRLVGGILPAGAHRLEAAGARGIPQVVSLGALDVVNFGPPDSVPEPFRDRRLYQHNPAVTLMRTSPEESDGLGRALAAKLNGGHGPRTVVAPLRGLSALSGPGAPFHDPDADRALLDALRAELADDVELLELDSHINDPAVAVALADRFHAAYQQFQKESVNR